MKINITMNNELLKELNEKIKEIGATRSGFIASSVRFRLDYWKKFEANKLNESSR